MMIWGRLSDLSQSSPSRCRHAVCAQGCASLGGRGFSSLGLLQPAVRACAHVQTAQGTGEAALAETWSRSVSGERSRSASGPAQISHRGFLKPLNIFTLLPFAFGLLHREKPPGLRGETLKGTGECSAALLLLISMDSLHGPGTGHPEFALNHCLPFIPKPG